MNEELNILMSDFLSDHTPKHGLPASAYTDPEFWRVECETIFTQHWIFVGFAHSLANPGDVIPITVANQPLILIKNKAGEIAAFHNVCRHRCLKLVESPKNVGNLLCCPYHAWSYHLDGRLNNAPFFGGKDKHYPPGFNAADHGLKPVKTAVWHDWIFINLDGNAPPFETHVSALSKRLDGINLDEINPVATLDFGEISTNWKFIMENFIEPYHVQFVHRTTTSQPLKDHYTIIDGVCLGSAVDLDENNKASSGSLSVSSRYLALFPNFIVGRYFPDQLGVYLNIPVDAGHMLQKRVIYTTDGQTRTEDEIAFQKKLWWDVHKEDHEMCERLQLGRASPVANDGGRLSPHWEDNVHAFQKLVVGAVMQSSKHGPK